MRCCEESFEANPIFLLCWQKFPVFEVVYKETGLKDELENDTDEFFEAVGSINSGGVITAVLTL